MGTLISGIVKITLQVLAGLGVAKALDTFVAPKVGPVGYPEAIYPGTRMPKVFWFIGAFVVGILILKFIGRKMRISILK